MCKWSIAITTSVLPLAMAAQCSPGLSPGDCLTIEQVTNIPPGNAQGTVDWGTYRPVSNVRTSCARCSLNTIPDSMCTDSTVDPDGRATFMQVDGVLSASGSDSLQLTGGINSDGTFTLGAIVTPMSGEGTSGGQGLALLEGQFVGNRIIATLTSRLTVNDTGGETIDLLSVATVTYEHVDE